MLVELTSSCPAGREIIPEQERGYLNGRRKIDSIFLLSLNTGVEWVDNSLYDTGEKFRKRNAVSGSDNACNVVRDFEKPNPMFTVQFNNLFMFVFRLYYDLLSEVMNLFYSNLQYLHFYNYLTSISRSRRYSVLCSDFMCTQKSEKIGHAKYVVFQLNRLELSHRTK